MRRIPSQVTDRANWQRYWRDTRMLNDLKEMVSECSEVAKDSMPAKVEHYREASRYLALAEMVFRNGWNLPYVES